MIGTIRTVHSTRHAGMILRSVVMLVAMGAGATAIAPVHAQGTTASIFGHGPAGAQVSAQNGTGGERHTTINSSGRYKLMSVPMGTYTITLQKDDKTLDTRKNITLTVGRGAQIDFACPNDKCEAGDS